jgi:hypothetical protein
VDYKLEAKLSRRVRLLLELAENPLYSYTDVTFGRVKASLHKKEEDGEEWLTVWLDNPFSPTKLEIIYRERNGVPQSHNYPDNLISVAVEELQRHMVLDDLANI